MQLISFYLLLGVRKINLCTLREALRLYPCQIMQDGWMEVKKSPNYAENP
ncbi:MAG: hypothetical protein SAK29_08475 [Scytonema sp. PMC 1069.18]|nr:hypothetical protein [Scytonema sp. PMC 1069.18]